MEAWVLGGILAPSIDVRTPYMSQDVLVVTAPGSGAEIIPFLKTWVNLPMAIVFTVGYAKVGALSAGADRSVGLTPVA